jgi:hypothetical protein
MSVDESMINVVIVLGVGAFVIKIMFDLIKPLIFKDPDQVGKVLENLINVVHIEKTLSGLSANQLSHSAKLIEIENQFNKIWEALERQKETEVRLQQIEKQSDKISMTLEDLRSLVSSLTTHIEVMAVKMGIVP